MNLLRLFRRRRPAQVVNVTVTAAAPVVTARQVEEALRRYAGGAR